MEKMKVTIQSRSEQTTNPDLSALLGEATPRSMSPSMSWDSSDVLYESNGCATNSPAKHKASDYVVEDIHTMVDTASVFYHFNLISC